MCYNRNVSLGRGFMIRRARKTDKEEIDKLYKDWNENYGHNDLTSCFLIDLTKVFMKISFAVKKTEELYLQRLYVMPRNMISLMSFPIARLYFSLGLILNSRKKDTPANYWAISWIPAWIEMVLWLMLPKQTITTSTSALVSLEWIRMAMITILFLQNRIPNRKSS